MTDFLIVEDELQSAILYRGELYEENVAEQIDFVTSAHDAIRYVERPNPPNKYLVDINLGAGREYDGIKVLEAIKDKCPNSLVIVYSAYDVRKRCNEIELPNLKVYSKDPGTNEDDFKSFKELSIKHNAAQMEKLPEPESFIAQIAHVVRDGSKSWVKLVFKMGEDEFEKIVPFRPVWLAMNKSIKINEWIKITVLEEDTVVKYIYERGSAPPSNEQQFTGIDDDTFMLSKIWHQSDL